MARFEIAVRQVPDAGVPGTGADGLFELGLMYCTGRDVDMDLVTAHKWFNLAALRGNEDAKRYRIEISRDMSKPEIARAQRMAREWLSRH
jgi:hypothetical protein